ncbi:MAG: hypothetical protein RR588_00310 [Solibacillus sp.]
MSEQELQAIKEQLANIPEGWTITEGARIIKGLKVGGDYLVAEVEFLHAQRDSQAETIEKVRAENERLREALEFYANYEHWLPTNLIPFGEDEYRSDVDLDGGKIANQALRGDTDAI